ncbi:DNA helicase [Sporosarcina sp. NCCP-2716]|uniref:UvrD-helicase domain-containing protein n=1 Tax=Sporosarcina sp. NCCP-2716 TaxID=2943679 RepID=UPI00203C71E2|nr:UvrD-helicase domain-containing protein [Sporosarcina sp. NCCP-2716]GKV68954.1 DNA helicase [Sporosarcina sp. NCCP-2716]
MQITDKDILYSEGLLLKDGESFNAERREIIESLDTVDVLASPGSGKTTTLLAKLAILNTKLPLENNEGICILTHTNTAIDEVKKRLGVSGVNLFRYPNNCSTIQSFINQFLAIPAYIYFYGKRPLRIDDEIYNEAINKELFNHIPWKLRYGIQKQRIDVTKIRFNLDNSTLVNGLHGNPIYKNHESDSYVALEKLKESIMEDGILCYDDAYYLSFKYLRTHPNLKEIFSKRFRYVFIDEMQDTMEHQITLLNSIFDETVVIQRIGDPNQAIYDDPNATGLWDINKDSILEISDSKRFSRKIASVVQNVCISPQELVGNSLIEEINPRILVFSEASQKNVLLHFSRLIIENNLHIRDSNIFKAVGWVSEHESELGITSYWDMYEKERKKKIDFDHLKSYLAKGNIDEVINQGSNLYRKRILRGFVKALRTMNEKNEGKYFTEQSFLRYLQENNEEVFAQLLLNLSKWCLKIQNDEEILSEVTAFISCEIKEIFKWSDTSKLNTFFQTKSEDVMEEHQVQTNVFTFSEDETDVSIEISSIHGVKGETHTATLYLETFYFDYDIKRIIEYLKGQHTKTTAKRKLQNLKMTYVGMTRPSHLLCIAIREETIDGHEEELKAAGWEIEYVDKVK